MAPPVERLYYHIRGAFVVFFVLAAFQYWQSSLTIRFVLLVSVAYIVLRMGFDVIRRRYTHS